MMWIRKSAVAVLAMGILATANDCSSCYARLARSTESFQKYFQALKTSEASVNPVERFVFSLILANTKVEQPVKTKT